MEELAKEIPRSFKKVLESFSAYSHDEVTVIDYQSVNLDVIPRSLKMPKIF